jgi:uncharacterized protein YjbJ (UPF0337 family)
MKASIKDQVKGKFNIMKGSIKALAGKISKDNVLEDEGKDEKIDGKFQQKMGEIEKVVGK